MAGSTTAALLDVFPIFRILPDWAVPMKRHAKELHQQERNLYMGYWTRYKKAVECNTAKPCISQTVLEAQEEEGFSDELASYIIGSFLEAASDTTAAELRACKYF